jgi:hypothetical protein
MRRPRALLITLYSPPLPLKRPRLRTRVLTAEKWALGGSRPSITPDGATAVVPVTVRHRREQGLTDLWLIPVGGGRQLTSDKATTRHRELDGKLIAFVSKRGDDTESQIYVIAIDDGEARRVTNLPTGARYRSGFRTRLAFMSEMAGLFSGRPGARKERRFQMSARLTKAPISYFDHYLMSASRTCFRSRSQMAIPASSHVGLSLVEAGKRSFSYGISPDGLEVAFAAGVDEPASTAT